MKRVLLAAIVAVAALPVLVHADTTTDACSQGISYLEKALPYLDAYGPAALQQVMDDVRAAEPGGENCETDPRGLYLAAIGSVIVAWAKHGQGDGYATDLDTAIRLLTQCKAKYAGTKMAATCEGWLDKAAHWKTTGFPAPSAPPSPP